MATAEEAEAQSAKNQNPHHQNSSTKTPKPSLIAALSAALSRRRGRAPRLIGTLYGVRQGPAHIAFQSGPLAWPAALLQLPTQTGALVKEMAGSGPMRILLECERRGGEAEKGGRRRRLVEEKMWRVFCNGRRCGFAIGRECGGGDWRLLGAAGRGTVGAGVVPGEGEGEGVVYVRGVFERVVGSEDSEAFYMMDPDGGGGGGGGGWPEFSVYFLRV